MAIAVGAALSGVVAGSTAIAWAGGGFSLFLGFSGSAFLKSLALSAVSKLLQPKPKKSGSGFDQFASGGLTQQFRQAITEHRIVYGECRVSGAILYIGTSPNNQYLNMIVHLASHEIDAIDELIVNDESVPIDALDGSGAIISGKYAGFITVKRYLGTDTQTADATLLAETSDWTAAHRLQGLAYMYLRIKWDRDKFPSGIPNFSAWVRGKKCIDTRGIVIGDQIAGQDGEYIIGQDTSFLYGNDPTLTALKVWTPNTALHAFDNLTDPDWGIGASYGKVSDASADEAANICDEMVQTKNIVVSVLSANATTDILTLQGSVLELFRGDKVWFTSTNIGGVTTATDYYVIPYQRAQTPRIRLATTLANAINGVSVNITSNGVGTLSKQAEPRYHGGGVLSMTAERGENLKDILTGMGGKVLLSGGRWHIRGLAYRTPIYSFNENDLAGAITVQTKVSKKDRFNAVQGAYISQINQGNPSDYPLVKSSVYETTDGQEIRKKMDMPHVQRPQHAQRIAKILMEFERQEIRFTARFKLTALKLMAGDNFFFSFDRYGWTNKVFEVIDWELGVDTGGDAPVPYVEITAKETASAVFDFTSATDETTVDPALNTTLPNAFNVTVPTGFGLDSIPVSTLAGDTTYKILATWDAHPDFYVTSGGQFEIQYKLSSSTSWARAGLFDGDATEAELFQAELDTTYDVRIRAINQLGVRSNYSLIESFVVGLTGGITAREDWENATETRNPDDWETDTAVSESWE